MPEGFESVELTAMKPIRNGEVSQFEGGEIESSNAVVRAHPQMSGIIGEEAVNHHAGQTVGDEEGLDGSRRPFESVQPTAFGSHPDDLIGLGGIHEDAQDLIAAH